MKTPQHEHNPDKLIRLEQDAAIKSPIHLHDAILGSKDHEGKRSQTTQ
jgi:hypothetical protein